MRIMKKGIDLWHTTADARVITINLCVNRSGRAVMGRGLAEEANTRYPGLDQELGRHISNYEANPVNEIDSLGLVQGPEGEKYASRNLLFLPVKPVVHSIPSMEASEHPGWKCGSKDSYKNPYCRLKVMQTMLAYLPFLVQAVDITGYKKVAMPRPGCGFGGLSWSLVRPWLEDMLDDRFYVYSK